jgi:hypothetical protein
MQLLIFPETQEESMRREINEMRISLDKQRRAQFAQLADLKKMYWDLSQEYENLKKAICRGG